MNMRQLAAKYLENVAECGKCPISLEMYEDAVNLAVTYFGAERDINEIRMMHVDAYFNSDTISKADGAALTCRHIKRNKRVLRHAFQFALECNLISQLPIPKFEMHDTCKKTGALCACVTADDSKANV